MKLKTVVVGLAVIILLGMVFLILRAYLGQKNKVSVSELTQEIKKEFLEDINFSKGGYALILDDKKPPVLIDDITVLNENKDSIELKTSWLNYLPGEGRWPYGLRLFKNNTLIDAKLARKFKTFRVGNLRAHGRPLELESIYEPKAAFERMKDSLEKNDKIFISRVTETNPDGFEYRFTLSCPSILVVENDTTFDKHTFGLAFADRITQSLSAYSGFKAGANAGNSTEPSPLLVLKKDGTTHYLRNAENNRILPLVGYELHGNSLIFSCTKEFYEQIQSHDFSASFIREGLLETEIKMLIGDEIGTDREEVQTEAVYGSMFQTGFEIGELIERKYELKYFELIQEEK